MNVLSELMRPQPSEHVLKWVDTPFNMSLFTTTITQAAILFGLALLPPGRRRSELMIATEQINPWVC